MFGFCVALVVFVTSAKNLATLDLSNLQQVIEDWTKLPFVDIKSQAVPCEGDWENVWERRWGGMEEGCLREG